MLRLVSA